MKKILFILLLFPIFLFSQVSSWRSGGSMGGGSVGSNRMVSPPQQNYSNWRNTTPNTPYYNRNVIVNRPIWVGGMYPWFNGFGYYNMFPYFWYDDFGYRNRGHIRVYNDGKKDTLYTKPMRYNFGLQFSRDREVGGWLAIGNKTYVMVDFLQTSQKNSSSYFPNGRLSAVDFPLVNDWVRNTSFYIGAGQRHGRNGVHLSVGIIGETVRFQGKDQLGYITFPKSSNDYVSLKVGWLYDFKNRGSMKIDYDAIRQIGLFGFGFHL